MGVGVKKQNKTMLLNSCCLVLITLPLILLVEHSMLKRSATRMYSLPFHWHLTTIFAQCLIREQVSRCFCVWALGQTKSTPPPTYGRTHGGTMREECVGPIFFITSLGNKNHHGSPIEKTSVCGMEQLCRIARLYAQLTKYTHIFVS